MKITQHPLPRILSLLIPASLLTGAAQVCLAAAPADTVTVRVDQPGAAIPPTLFGLFFEDINFAADGGLYPERVKNRSFEFPDPLQGWRDVNGPNGVRIAQYDRAPGAGESRYLHVNGGNSIANEGFRGMGVQQGAVYRFSVRARRTEGQPSSLRITVRDAAGRSLGEARVTGLTTEWKTYSVPVAVSGTEEKAHLTLQVEGGAADLDDVSLFPEATWDRRSNGLRADLVKLLKEMKPGFLRFPGGCIVEGRTLESRYQWKTTVGDLKDRKLIVNRWNTEFRHRPTPDYYQSFGLGFYEYFQLCEDIGAEPLPVLNCGMACQFNTGELAPLDRLDPYLQDALDLIEFANGPASSKWGRLRARMGHAAPFGLKLIGVGNEQWGPDYFPRYEAFTRAIKRKYPAVQIVSSAGPSPSGSNFDYAWTKLRERNADIVDEHYYEAPKWFRENAGRYDHYPRTGPKVFAGEYAAQSVGIARPDNRNNWECALSEAAFITGLERNADVVRMSSYAPLFGHVEGWQWTPNLIWFDNLRSYGTPNYYVQKTFSTNRGTTILPVLEGGSKHNGEGELFTSAARDDRSGEVILKLVNTIPAAREVLIELAGAKTVGRSGTATVLGSKDLKAENSLLEPTRVSPVTRAFAVSGGRFTYTLEPNSLTVLRVAASAR